MVSEYQNIVLYQMMAERWNSNLDDKTRMIQDLNQMHLAAYVGIYEDKNDNNILDFEIDSLMETWTHKQDVKLFDYMHYSAYGDKDFIADSILYLEQPINTPYASYGFFGDNKIPAIFLEFPIQTNKIIAYWLILNHPLPRDIDWTTIILPVTITLILILNFLIIRSFLQPIQRIKQHVQQLKRGTLGSQIPITTNDELAELSITINKMTRDIERLVNQKQNLLIDVSHELKTPLTRLKFIVANMALEEEEKQGVNKEINFLQDMISNMLLSDKLSTPYIEDLDKKMILLNDLIQNTCDMFYRLDQKLEIINNSQEQEEYLDVDNYKMSLAIKNLIDNGIKYGNTNQLTQLIVNTTSSQIVITVKDFGAGITKEQIKEITKPLYRGRAAKEQNKTGFGLGLAITKKIVEAHGGALNINSILGQGSEFIITLPKEAVNEKH